MDFNILKLLGYLAIGQTEKVARTSGGTTGIFNMLLPFILIFGIFYFLVILPQKKQQKKHVEMLNSLQKGQTVMMNCGIKGRISEIKNNDIKLEISPKVIITIQKSAISGVVVSEAVENQETK